MTWELDSSLTTTAEIHTQGSLSNWWVLLIKTQFVILPNLYIFLLREETIYLLCNFCNLSIFNFLCLNRYVVSYKCILLGLWPTVSNKHILIMYQRGGRMGHVNLIVATNVTPSYTCNIALIKRAKCKECLYYKICDGSWIAYLNQFGDNEIKPIIRWKNSFYK